jgi:hypothetical protein
MWKDKVTIEGPDEDHGGYDLVLQDGTERVVGLIYDKAYAEDIADVLNTAIPTNMPNQGAHLIMHLCQNPNPPEDEPNQHLMCLVWAPQMEGLIKRFLYRDTPLEAIHVRTAESRLMAETWTQNLGRFLASKGLYVFPSWNTGWSWFARYRVGGAKADA